MDEVLSKFLSPEIIEFNCPECSKKSLWTKTQRIQNYPQYLIIVFQRFVFDWVPIKLEVSFEPKLDNFDIKILSETQKKENEKILDVDKEEEFEKEFNKEIEKEKKDEDDDENLNLIRDLKARKKGHAGAEREARAARIGVRIGVISRQTATEREVLADAAAEVRQSAVAGIGELNLLLPALVLLLPDADIVAHGIVTALAERPGLRCCAAKAYSRKQK